jgi:hypothetical protein
VRWDSKTHRRCNRCQEKRRIIRLNRPRKCLNCSKDFLAHRGLASRFCSQKCKYEHQVNQRVHYCPNCNAPIRGRQTYRQVACSRKCGAILRQQKHPALTEKRYRYMEIASWSDLSVKIQERDGKKCILANCKGLFPSLSALHTDHFFPFRLVRSWGKDANDPKNLNTLCVGHHAEKTHIEQKLLRGDWLGFMQGITRLGFPEDRVKAVCELYGVGP